MREELLRDHIMKKKKFDYKQQTLDISELVKQRPVLTEEEMKEFCTYEEIVADAIVMFEEEVQKIWREYDSKNRKRCLTR